MIEFAGQVILLDVEGTTSSVAFVYERMFPFVREHLASFLAEHWDQADVAAARDQIAADAGVENFAVWGEGQADGGRQKLLEHVFGLMDSDVKSTGLKQLQGLVWRRGFTSGALCAHVYDDVAPALRRWTDAGIDVRIYSSGSIAAQQLFFGHTIVGDLRPYLSGHYDTTIGSKQKPESYAAIVRDIAIAADQVLFVSDVVAELDAARQGGMKTALSLRPGNAPVSRPNGHAAISSFAQIVLAGQQA